ALIGALAVASLDRRIRKGPTLIAAGAAFALLLAAFALSQRYLLSVGLLALTGGTMIVNNALANATIQEIVPDQLRGPVMGFGACRAPSRVSVLAPQPPTSRHLCRASLALQQTPQLQRHADRVGIAPQDEAAQRAVDAQRPAHVAQGGIGHRPPVDKQQLVA